MASGLLIKGGGRSAIKLTHKMSLSLFGISLGPAYSQHLFFVLLGVLLAFCPKRRQPGTLCSSSTPSELQEETDSEDLETLDATSTVVLRGSPAAELPGRKDQTLRDLGRPRGQPHAKGLGNISRSLLWSCAGRKIGEGAFAEVYSLRGGLSDCCVKYVKSTFADDRVILKEMHFMLKLQHIPGTARLVDYVTRPLGIVMIRHDKTLRAWIREDAPTPKELLPVLIELCQTMNQIHAAGVCHNDLKENNVMVDFRGSEIRPTVIDYGLMRSIGEAVFKVGTLSPGGKQQRLEKRRRRPWYAPSLYLGGPCSPSTDAYALAVMIRNVLNLGPGSDLGEVVVACVKGSGRKCRVDVLLDALKKANAKISEGTREFRPLQ